MCCGPGLAPPFARSPLDSNATARPLKLCAPFVPPPWVRRTMPVPCAGLPGGGAQGNAVHVGRRLEHYEAAVAADARVQRVAGDVGELRDPPGERRVDENLAPTDGHGRAVAHVQGVGAEIAVGLEGDLELDELPVARD